MELAFDEFKRPLIILKEQVQKIRMRDLSVENPNERLRCSEGQHCSGQGHHENPLHLTPLHAPEPLSSLVARVVLLVGTRSPAVGLAASSQEASINNTRIPSLGTTASALEEPIAPPTQ